MRVPLTGTELNRFRPRQVVKGLVKLEVTYGKFTKVLQLFSIHLRNTDLRDL